MPAYVVFVHGVANRESEAYKQNVAKRDERFRKLVFGDAAKIENPYWGKFGANPDGGVYKSLPDYDNPHANGIEKLSVADRPETGEVPKLVELAREDFPETVDLIFEGVFEELQEGGNTTLPDDAVKAAQLAAEYALAIPTPPWIAQDMSDDEFLKNLTEVSEAFHTSQSAAPVSSAELETLGIGNWLKTGAKAMIDRVRNAGGRVALAAGRDVVHGQIATFIGDVFSYLKDGSGREPIRALMRDEIGKAVQSGDPIVLIGHSMGGVILADCLGDPAFCQSVGLKDGRKVDALVTVGSQPGFFQELGLLGMQSPGTLPVVKTWINVFDELDVLSFLAAPVFNNTKDLMFSSRTGILSAHTAYFSRVQFYKRLQARLKEAGIPVT